MADGDVVVVEEKSIEMAVEAAESSKDDAVDEKPAALAPMKISFGMKSKKEVQLRPDAVQLSTQADDVNSDDDEVQEIETKRRKLTHFEDGMFPEDEEDRRRKAKAKIVIPMVIERDWRVAKLLQQQKDGTLSDDDKARLELLLQSDPNAAQDLAGETGENAIVVDTLKTINNEDADYSQVPIEQFGLAVLRGCGWNDGEGIGKSNKQVVPLRVLLGRPKGLGLGATPKAPPAKEDSQKNGNKNPDEEVPRELKKGCYVKILNGIHRDTYGTVESRDDDMASVFVRLALKNQAIRVSLYGVEAVSKKEFDKEGKCLNKRDYDRVKATIDERNNGVSKNDEERRERKERKRDEKDRDRDSRIDRRKDEVWARPDLVVRLIDEKYASGRFTNEKMRIVDVADRKNLTLIDERGKQHYSIRQSWVETVIPRDSSEKVLILRGRHSGVAARVEEKYKSESRLLARILHSNELVKISYDDVCHFRPTIDDGEE